VPLHEETVILELARADVMDVNADGADKLTECGHPRQNRLNVSEQLTINPGGAKQ
jgi:hypothetical protein